MEDKKETFLLIDGNAILYRAFYALPPLTTKKGEIINAVYGFLLVLFKVIKEFRPKFLAVTFDFPAPTFREKIFKEYKAQRPKMPEDLTSQIPHLKKILKSFGIKIYEKEGYEADDLIGSIAEIIKKEKKNIEVIIVTGDLDVLQLVNASVKVYLLKRGIKETTIYDKNLVKEKLGILPRQVPDFKALFGDPSDNIPGVLGIGKKTASLLLEKFKNLEELYKGLERGTDKIPQSIKKNLLKGREKVFFSRELILINKDALKRQEFSFEECNFKNLNQKKGGEIMKSYGFLSLVKRLPEVLNKETSNKRQSIQQSLI
ncbi:MAG: hypothetical protein LR000_02265 [Candidatus Pacebacteria bacterium]|nr:hypothetical protein [Candidatus Paceibacterota bacterium]